MIRYYRNGIKRHITECVSFSEITVGSGDNHIPQRADNKWPILMHDNTISLKYKTQHRHTLEEKKHG